VPTGYMSTTLTSDVESEQSEVVPIANLEVAFSSMSFTCRQTSSDSQIYIVYNKMTWV